jgi:hypothetical protein
MKRALLVALLACLWPAQAGAHVTLRAAMERYAIWQAHQTGFEHAKVGRCKRSRSPARLSCHITDRVVDRDVGIELIGTYMATATRRADGCVRVRLIGEAVVDRRTYC